MRAKDLRKYKTLDITELSGSPWNNAEKVLGLDDNDKVIMAEPDGVVTPEDVADAIASETARTEETYIKQEVIPEVVTGSRVGVDGDNDMLEFVKSDTSTGEVIAMQRRYIKKINGISIITPLREDNIELPTEEDIEDAISQAMDDYYTKEEVDEALSGITVDLSDYYTKEEVDELIDDIPEPDLSDYYTKEETDQAISSATQDMATEQYVNDAIADIPPVDLSGYALISSVTADINTAIANETARTESTYAKPSDIPSLDGYATEEYVDDAIADIPQVDLSEYAKTTAVTQDIQTAIASETARTESTYAKPSQIPSLDGYATEQWVESQGYLTEHQDLSAYAKTTAVTQDIQTAMAAETARTESTYLKEHQSLDNYYTKSQVDAEISGATEGLASEQYVDDAIAAIPATDLSDYYTKEEVDAEITGATEDMATKTWVGQQGYLTQHQDLSDYAKTTAVTEDIASAMAAETARTENTYAKPSQIPSLAGYATEQYVDDAIASETARTESTYLKEHQDISGKLDKTDFDTYTGATETALAGKLDATAYTIDNTIDSASTNPVENRAIYAALNGESVQTQMEISNVDSSVMVAFIIESSDFSQQSQIGFYLKETNIPGYYAIPTKTIVDCATTVSSPYYFEIQYLGYNNNYYTPNQDVQITENNLGTNIPFQNYSGHITYFSSDLDGTFEYYFVYNTDGNYGMICKTLPSFETISDHKANVSDLPTAQDGSGFNQFVYNGSGNKTVLSNFSPGYGQNITSNDRQSRIIFNITPWGGSPSQTSTGLPRGNECIDGVKTDRDSQVISKAEEALNGFTEQITLTLGNRSATEKITAYQDLYLYETNNPRYLAVPTSEAYAGYIQNVTLSGTTYYVSNPLFSSDNYRPVTGKYQLGTASNTFSFNKSIVGNTYIIIDTELLTLEISDSLTITRAKNIQDAITSATQNFVTSGDVANQIDTAMASETARTESTYAKPSQIPSLTGYATETWVQNQGYLTQHQSLAEYYTKSEIDGMIGDIESLLASI